MAVPSLSQLFTPLTRDDVLAAMLKVAADLDLPIEAYESGSVGREILTIIAQAVADNTQTGAVAAAGGLLDYATFDWLTLLVYEVYGIERIPATFASGQVTLTNNGTTTYNPAAGDLRFIATSGQAKGQTYTSTSGGTLSAGGGTLVVNITADQPGSASTASTGDIAALATPLLGVTCTNAAPLFGVDEESDTALAARARESLAKASPNGPGDAYFYYAKSAIHPDDKTPVGVTRCTVIQGNGSLQVYVANEGGAVTGDTTLPQTNTTDLGLVNWAIQSNCVPTGITAVVQSAVVNNITVRGTVYLAYTSSESESDAQEAVLEQLRNYFATIPIGGFSIPTINNQVFREALVGQIYEAIPGSVVQVTLDLPANDVTLAQNEVAVLVSVANDFMIQRALAS
jgi:hypothetical protein